MNKITLGIIFVIVGLVSIIAQDFVKGLSEILLGLIAFINGIYMLMSTRRLMADKNFQLAVTIRGVVSILVGLGCAVTVLIVMVRFGFAKAVSDPSIGNGLINAPMMSTEASDAMNAVKDAAANMYQETQTLDALHGMRDHVTYIVGYILSGLFGVSAILEAYTTYKLFNQKVRIWFPVIEILITLGLSVIFSLQELLPHIFYACGIIIVIFGIVFISMGAVENKNKQQPDPAADNKRVEDLKEAEKV